MKISIDEIKKEPLKKERLAYNGRTGNRIDVEVHLSPLRAMYKVGKEGDKDVNLFSDLDSAVEKFNLLEEGCLSLNNNKHKAYHCKLCGSYIKEDNLSVCDKCASEYQY
ncbi:hypothetical protein C823_007872 [Eubacterium plexicaudatum ASF492]|uniref:Uncharacterized protein n=1 Tax=Eubacterium plexicaudatum ASF492 TaxID=1235802 RepID=N1ZVZ8_9FIRM|nr:hypothetical protein C823_007872 [Eubacterium plexicaudatum ASF492]